MGRNVVEENSCDYIRPSSSNFVSSLEERIDEEVKIMAEAYDECDTKDTWNLRYGASFEIKVSDGVWWVPASAQGKSLYTNR